MPELFQMVLITDKCEVTSEGHDEVFNIVDDCFFDDSFVISATIGWRFIEPFSFQFSYE